MSLAHLGPIASHHQYEEPKAYAEYLMSKAGSSFAFGMRMLPEQRRAGIFAVYAFCRVVDDIADEPGEVAEKKALLKAWREEIDLLYKGTPASLVGRALLQPVNDYKIPKQEFLLMIDGMEADVDGPLIVETMTDLLSYTRQVAGTVGMMSIRIFGVSDKPARDVFALNLADAFQLTNVLRDVDEDADINRLYLPRDLLKEHGINLFEPKAVAENPNLRPVRRVIGKLARARFNAARRALEDLPGEPLRSALIMMGVYETYLERMEVVDFDRDESKLKMSKLEKVWHGLRYAWFFPKRPIHDSQQIDYPLADIEPS